VPLKGQAVYVLLFLEPVCWSACAGIFHSVATASRCIVTPAGLPKIMQAYYGSGSNFVFYFFFLLVGKCLQWLLLFAAAAAFVFGASAAFLWFVIHSFLFAQHKDDAALMEQVSLYIFNRTD
jgi:hypothetical protein